MADRRGNNRSRYNRMAPFYERLLGWGSFGTIGALYGAVGEALELPQDACVLEFGCGPGTLTPYLLERVGEKGTVLGVDISDRMIERARRKAAEMGWQNARFERSDIHDYAAPMAVDAVVFSLALSAMPDSSGCLEKAWTILEPGGQLVILDSFPQPSRRVANFFVHLKAPLVGAVPTREALDFVSQRMEEVRETPLSGGVYTLVSARKPRAEGGASGPSA